MSHARAVPTMMCMTIYAEQLASTAMCIGTSAGAKDGGKSLLGRDEPSRWYEAAEALPPLAGAADAGPADDAAVEAARTQAEAALKREAEILERTMPARVGGADARWLQQVRRSGTTADKVAAHSLIIQARDQPCDTSGATFITPGTDLSRCKLLAGTVSGAFAGQQCMWCACAALSPTAETSSVRGMCVGECTAGSS